MPFGDLYERQVRLLIRTLPYVLVETEFALKGGTAINLFVRDLPRLSVDIDLTYLPVRERGESLAAIDAGLRRIAAAMAAGLPGVVVTPGQARPEGTIDKLLVAADGVQIKIEVTPVLRGTVFAPELRSVAPAVEDRFGFAEAQMVSLPDLYGGKIAAALDRQHPRDLFDVRDLLANEGVGDQMRQAFIAYLISHPRPMAEVLRPRRKDIAEEFRRGFVGMTKEPVDLDDLIAAREALIAIIVAEMPAEHRAFLIGFKRGDPDWDLIGLPTIADLPAVRWKQRNLDQLAPDRRDRLVEGLRAVWPS
ncbi:nucleotidyl transferase AbiEii/AbiGii toxin family protein [Brevundimonas sp. BAL450]|jgi:predicted nucleotidyltransferase component of viral defense system|uniref:Ync protein n=1 Tax=Brevundimonas abyssalis TAR-001 TaxID=1391729 RepID=A0A8E0NAL4_9CAUL|nr:MULTISPECIES: nucleotidyl transferase AbiEii/AbiGii toxin family protein [Brevundimonas]MBG7616664.1 nucleotidyl transferase AbiEii/AbiGii toxin family protein [Brevundimonas sp. BAL450]GAD58531.1 ync protein [Brevundimonas abyssalis TAR-001]